MIRLLGYFFGIGALMFFGVAAAVAVYIGDVSKDLPKYEVLAQYEPPVTTRIHADDGALMGEFAHQRRLYLPIQAVPDRVKAAFISAEDKNFYHHPGIDISGLGRAIMVNLQNFGSGKRPVGASTITQQVAKNFLLSNDQTLDRKIKEAILSLRIEQAYSKDRILELYLNEIFFGLNSYGIAGAALTYYDKSVNELTIAEAAYLAALPKGPSNYHPFRQSEKATIRRNYVIDQMLENKYITLEEANDAKKQPLGVNPRSAVQNLFASEYFTEEVRREIVDRYGEAALYEGGLSVRTTLNPRLQVLARGALHKGLIRYDELRGYRGAFKHIELGEDWGLPLGAIELFYDLPEWKLAVVLDSGENGATVGLQPDKELSGAVSAQRDEGTIAPEDMKWAFRLNIEGEKSKAKNAAGVLRPGDVVFVEPKQDSPGNFRLRQIPEISGSIVAMDPHTGRVLAMIGGFTYAQSQFNRATQGMRQPGSSFKPFVYAAALDNGYTPASVVLDAPIEIDQGGSLGIWAPKNYSGKPAGPSTLRLGIEQSRNLMTVRLAKDMGMKLVAEYAERFGVYDHMLPVLSMALGSGETTTMRMVSAYSVFANGGKAIKPSLIDRIQDRYGKTIFKHDERACEGCSATSWLDQPEPELVDNRDQVLDPMTAYQITSMMQGVVQRGTASNIKNIGMPVAGKTGTTNEEKDAWFIGYTPDLVVGVMMGYDKPTPMGKGSTGGALCAPIFEEFVQAALKDVKPVDFRVPEGMTEIAIDRKTGMRAFGSGPNVILEAFKPGTGPADSYSVIGMGEIAVKERSVVISPKAMQAIQSGSGGGLY
jgi:penicillin-binding protein 1A